MNKPKDTSLNVMLFEYYELVSDYCAAKRQHDLILRGGAKEKGEPLQGWKEPWMEAFTNEEKVAGTTSDSIKRRIELCTVVEPAADTEAVGLGVIITGYDSIAGEDVEYLISGINGPMDDSMRRVSYNTPFGEAVMGKHLGETAEISAPVGKYSFKIKGLRQGVAEYLRAGYGAIVPSLLESVNRMKELNPAENKEGLELMLRFVNKSWLIEELNRHYKLGFDMASPLSIMDVIKERISSEDSLAEFLSDSKYLQAFKQKQIQE